MCGRRCGHRVTGSRGRGLERRSKKLVLRYVAVEFVEGTLDPMQLAVAAQNLVPDPDPAAQDTEAVIEGVIVANQAVTYERLSLLGQERDDQIEQIGAVRGQRSVGR